MKLLCVHFVIKLLFQTNIDDSQLNYFNNKRIFTSIIELCYEIEDRCDTDVSEIFIIILLYVLAIFLP